MRRRIPFLPLFLGMVFALFIGILVYVGVASEQANPVLLDEKGNLRP